MKHKVKNTFFLLLLAFSYLFSVFLPITAEENTSNGDHQEIRITSNGSGLTVKGIPEESSEKYKTKISSQYSDTYSIGEIFTAVNITYSDDTGKPVQPLKAIDITITDLSIPEGTKAAVFHIENDDVIIISSVNDTKSVSFTSEKTGVFLVAEVFAKHQVITAFEPWKDGEFGNDTEGRKCRFTVEYVDPTAAGIIRALPDYVYGYTEESSQIQKLPVSAWTHNYTDGETGIFVFTPEVDKNSYTVKEGTDPLVLEVAVNHPYSFSSTKAHASRKRISLKSADSTTSARSDILGGSYKQTYSLSDADKEDDYQKNYQEAVGSDENNYLLKSAEWEDMDEGKALITVTGQRNDIPRVVYAFITCQSHGFNKSICVRNIQQLVSKYPIVDVIAIDGPDEWGANAAAGGRVCGIEPVKTFTPDNASEISNWVNDSVYWRYGNHYTMNIPAALRKYLFGSINGTISEANMIRHPNAIFVSFDFLYDNANYGDGSGHKANQPYEGNINDAYDSSGMLWKYATADFFSFITRNYITGGKRYFSMSDVAKGSSGTMSIYGAMDEKESSDDQRMKIIEGVANPDKFGQMPCGAWDTDAYTTNVKLTGTPSDYDYSNDFSSANVPMPEGTVKLTDTISDRYSITSVETTAGNSAVTVKSTVSDNTVTASSSNYQPGTEITMKIHAQVKDTEAYFEEFENTNTGNAALTAATTTVASVTSPKLSRFKPKLTVQYLEKGTEKVLAAEYSRRYKPGETYNVPSPSVMGYMLDDNAQKTVTGTMPKKNHLIKVYYVKPTPPVKAVTNDAGKDIHQKYVNDGDTLHYTITFTNPASTEKEYTITDQVPENVTVKNIENGGKLESNTITWTIKVNGGTSATVKWNATANGKGVTITNSAKEAVEGIALDSNTVENWTPEDPIKHVLDESRKDIDRDMRISGQELTYTITIHNPASVWKQATVTDVLPDGTEFLSQDDGQPEVLLRAAELKELGFSQDGQILTWVIDMMPEEERTITVTVKILDSAKDSILKNKALLHYDYIELVTNEVENPVLPDPIKEVQDDEGNDIHQFLVNENDQLHYFITFRNPADETKMFTITDTVPEHTAFVSADHDGQLTASDTEEGVAAIVWQMELEPHAEETVGFIVKTVGTHTYIPNTGNVAVDEVNLDTNTVENWVPEDPVKKVQNEKGEDANYDVLFAQDSRRLTYFLEVNNNSSLEKEYTVTDELDEKLVFLSADHDGIYDEQKHMITWTITVSPDTTETLSFIAEPDNVSTGKKIVNDIEAESDNYNNRSNIVVNYLDDSPEKITIEGRKTWEMNNIDVELPDSIMIRLMANGEEIRSERITPDTDHNWSFSFTNVPKYMFGKEVEYTVSEDPVEGYQTVIEGNYQEGFTVINTKDPLPEKHVLNNEGTDINGRIVRIGEEITYTVTYTNPFETKKEYTITDKLPKGVKFLSADNEGTYKNGVVSWMISTPAGEERTVHVQVKVTEDAFETLYNRALVGVDDQKIITNEVENPVLPDPVKDVRNSDDISINHQEVRIGDELTYTVTFRNPYDSGADMTVTDELPEGLEYLSSSDDGIWSDGSVTWNIRMNANEERTVSAIVKVSDTASEVLVNDAVVTVDDVTVITNEVHNPVIKDPVKQVLDPKGTDIDGKTVHPKDQLVYTITYENPYDRDIQSTVTDRIPEGLKFVSVDHNGKEVNHLITWNVELKAYEKMTVSFTAEVLKTDYESFINSADVTIGSLKLKTNEVKNPLEYTPEIKPVKDVLNDDKQSVNGKEVKPDDLITYTIAFENPYDIEHTFTVTDVLPEEVEYVSADQGASELSYNKTTKVVWEVSVPAKQKHTVSIVARVKNPEKEITFKNTGSVFLNDAEFKTNEVKNSAKHCDECCVAEPAGTPATATPESGKPADNNPASPTAAPSASAQPKYIRNLPNTGDTSSLMKYGSSFSLALLGIGYAVYRLRKGSR